MTVLPIHKLFACSYLGTVESQMNKLKYDKVKTHFFVDYYNVSPIEDIETQMKKLISGENVGVDFTPAKRIQKSEKKRNLLLNDNILLKAL